MAETPLPLWQQFRSLLRELRDELRPEVISAHIDAWVERQKRDG